jgi:hypothetical protein
MASLVRVNTLSRAGMAAHKAPATAPPRTHEAQGRHRRHRTGQPIGHHERPDRPEEQLPPHHRG